MILLAFVTSPLYAAPVDASAQMVVSTADERAEIDLAPFVVSPLTFESVDGTVRGWWAEVDLTCPGLEVEVTPPLAEAPASSEAEADLIPTDRWARERGVALAVNANFFRTLETPAGSADVLGLSVSDGRVVSPARAYEGVQDPVLIFTRNGRARILSPGSAFSLDEVYDGVAGIGASATAPDRGGLLVEAGLPRGESARVAPQARHPRTAAGVNENGDRLMLVVIDGRQPGWSVGITLPELAELMIDRGAHAAINLDGGGSSAFYFDPAALPDAPTDHATAEPILNRPSDGAFRPVANHLGFRVTPEPDATAAE